MSLADGQSELTIGGSAVTINSVLNGLTYIQTPDYNGSATITITITTSDFGNTGTGDDPSGLARTVTLVSVTDAAGCPTGPR